MKEPARLISQQKQVGEITIKSMGEAEMMTTVSI